MLERPNLKGILLTFDDTYRDFWENALGALQGIPALIFVPAGLVGIYNQIEEGVNP
ncbi:MAG: hypothetical protein ACK4OF_00920 [Aquificaceae bacterium]